MVERRFSGDLTRAWVNLAHGSGQAVEKRFGRSSKGFFFHFFLDKKVEQKIMPPEKWAKNAGDGLNPARLAGRTCIFKNALAQTVAGFFTAIIVIFLTPFFRGRSQVPAVAR